MHNGDQWATFLLGALDGSSQMIGGPAPDPHTKFWGMYFQDDWKLNRRITLNLGIRNDYETRVVRSRSTTSREVSTFPSRFRR